MHRYAVRISEDASKDLDEITDYISIDNPAAAERWRQAITEKISRLSHVPRLGQERPEFAPGMRTLSFGRYLVCYQVEDAEALVEIGRVLHSARDFPAVFE